MRPTRFPVSCTDSASPRRPPAISTWAARAPRSSTGSTPSKYGGQFLLRVEDTDKARSTDESTRAIFEGLEWLGLDWDEDVVFQGANLARHQADAQRLLDAGAAYRCFCTPAELDERRKAAEAQAARRSATTAAARPLPPDEVAAARRARACRSSFASACPRARRRGTISCTATITFPNKDIGEGDFIILRSDGTPIYNLAVVSDDIAMRITLVMRGDDHISNTPKQILLYHALGAPIPQFAHLPMIHGIGRQEAEQAPRRDRRRRLSAHGHSAAGDAQLPRAARLVARRRRRGDDACREMIELFSTDGLLKKAAIFDTKKLEWMNGQHLAAMPAVELAPLVDARDRGARGSRRRPSSPSVATGTSRCSTCSRSARARSTTWCVRPRRICARTIEYDADAVAKQWKDRDVTRELLSAVRDTLASTRALGAGRDGDQRFARSPSSAASAPGSSFSRCAWRSRERAASPGIFDVLVLLGRERSLERIDAAVSFIG